MKLERKTFETTIGEKSFSLEFSSLAGQANASVIGKYGDTVVLATVVMGSSDRSTDFFPLVVDYEERFYAVGKIMGSRFMRREGRPSEEAILSARLIDRAIRPLFDQRLRREVQVVLTVLSFDGENDPDVIGMLAASAALAISDIPWNGPIGGVRVARIGSQLVFNPTVSELQNGTVGFHAFLAGAGETINMIELEGNEASEEDIFSAFEQTLPEIQSLVAFQKDIVASIGKEKMSVSISSPDSALGELVRSVAGDRLRTAFTAQNKSEKNEQMNAIQEEVFKRLLEEDRPESDRTFIPALLEEEVNALLHKMVLEEDRRPDGRKLDEVRNLYAETGILKRMHGSALFMRGDTQALAVTTLAPPGSEQLIESIELSGKRRFLLHYNFPKYSVGETGAFRGPGRREIGHGALALKALSPLLPSREEFPYTIRVVSEILSSNGSSSMATVCAGSLSLMDAGVPIKKAVAGIAMGLILGPDGAYKVLTDIQGPEDHHGDMDFKVAGTRDGVTALQMDVKVDGVSLAALRDGLAQAKQARFHILDTLNAAQAQHRDTVSEYAPKVSTILINPEKIGEIIGPGGRIINGIIARTGATIDVEEDGSIFIAGPTTDAVEQALMDIKNITREFEIGEIVEGTIIKVLDFGAIVDLGGGKDGMIHVSELKEGFVENVQDVVNVGDHVTAKVIKIESGKIGLSLKQAKK